MLTYDSNVLNLYKILGNAKNSHLNFITEHKLNKKFT